MRLLKKRFYKFMNKYQNQYRIKSTRLKYWDYSQSAFYFITICTDKRKYYFGQIINKKMYYSAIGRISKNLYKEIPKHYPFVTLDSFIIMPNHIHGIVIINRPEIDGGAWKELDAHNYKNRICRDTKYCVSTYGHHKNKFGPQSGNLGAIIRGFKAAVKKYATINQISFKWQSNYYEHIIRNENSLINIRCYIEENHAMWKHDRNNLDNLEKEQQQ